MQLLDGPIGEKQPAGKAEPSWEIRPTGEPGPLVAMEPAEETWDCFKNIWNLLLLKMGCEPLKATDHKAVLSTEILRVLMGRQCRS